MEKLKKILPEQQYKLIMQSQDEWEKYIKVNNSMLENVVEPQGPEDGLILYLQSTDIQTSNTLNRLEELNKIYFAIHDLK